MPFQSGDKWNGNANGRPVGAKSFTTKVRDALMKIAEGKDYTYEEAFVKAVLKKAIIDQDSQIIRLIWNYLDGMPEQKISGGDGNPLQINIVSYGEHDAINNDSAQLESREAPIADNQQPSEV